MSTIKQLKHSIDRIHTHHTENGVPLNSAIQWQADRSRFVFEELKSAYQNFYGEEPE